MITADQYTKAAEYIKERIGSAPKIAIVLGSGLASFCRALNYAVAIDYSDIPGFGTVSVTGHKGTLYAGEVGDTRIIVLSGRFHCYEGYSMAQAAFYTGVLKALGVDKLILTNAAGAVNENFTPGDIMLIKDHIKLVSESPLTGLHNPLFGERFPDMTHIYSQSLLNKARAASKNTQVDIQEGVYMYFAGPQYETPAEVRAAGILGADAVGMSTVPEAIAAAAAGMEVAGFSLITNMAAGVTQQNLSHSDVVEEAQKATVKFTALLKRFIEELNHED